MYMSQLARKQERIKVVTSRNVGTCILPQRVIFGSQPNSTTDSTSHRTAGTRSLHAQGHKNLRGRSGADNFELLTIDVM